MNEPRLTLELIQDTDNDENPFDSMDMLGEIAHWHPRVKLGSRNEVRLGRDQATIEDWLREQTGPCLPLYLYEHSGMTVRTGPFSDPWDSGQVGFIFTTRERYEKLCGKPTRNWKAKARKYLAGEVETLDQYLTGDVWGYRIADQNGHEIDSCWGFYGHNNAEKEAQGQLRYWTSHLCTPDLEGLEART